MTNRYAVSIFAGLVSFTNSYVWVATAPAADTLSNYFHTEIFFWASVAFGAGSAVGFVLGTIVPFRHKLRKVVLICCIFMAFAATLRVSSFSQNMTGFWILFAGNFVGGLPTTMLVGVPTRVAASWWPVGLQTVSVGLAQLVSSSGTLTGYLMVIYLMTGSGSQTNWFIVNGFLAGMVILATILALIFVKDSDHPQLKVAEDFGWDYSTEELRKRSSFVNVSLLIQFALGQAVFWSIFLTLTVTLTNNSGVAQGDANNVATTLMGSVVGGVIVACVLSDQLHAILIISRVMWWPQYASLLLLGLQCMGYISSDLNATFGLAAMAGFFLGMISPIMNTLVADAWYDLASLPQMIMFVTAQIVSAALVGLSIALDNNTFWYILFALFAVPTLLSLFNGYVILRKSHPETIEPVRDPDTTELLTLAVIH
jgi:MFS family permease